MNYCLFVSLTLIVQRHFVIKFQFTSSHRYSLVYGRNSPYREGFSTLILIPIILNSHMTITITPFTKIYPLEYRFQRIARRDKTAFLSDQCKEIEENNRMGKTRNLFKKIRDTKGTFHAKIGTIKDRSGMRLTKAEDIKKRWQEYTEELYKKDIHDPDNHNGMIPQLEPDILDCEVKWALGSITMNKISGGDRIPLELF